MANPMSEKWEEYFGGGRHWRIAEEYTGTESGVEFRQGRFELPEGQVFESPLSTNKGRRGVLLQEVDGQGQDIPGSLATFGDGAVKRARTQYKAIW